MDLIAFMEAMGTSSVPIIASFFIGLMVVISPCPLATNVAAIAYISRKLENKRRTFFIGLSYTLGRMIAYVSLAAIIVWFGVNVQSISWGLQKYGEQLLGPFLIVMGILMLDVVKLPRLDIGTSINLDSIKEKLSKKRMLGSFALGVIFALAFCPISAVLFFGMLVPLAVRAGDGLFIPSVFAFATGLPVMILSLILVHGVSKLGSVLNKIQTIEKVARRSVAVIFIIVGVYYALKMLGVAII